MDETRLEGMLRTHPCYSEGAHTEFARMHLPVAPRCNIQCNYCNRKYDCSNESRPGVTSEVLSPAQAADKVAIVKAAIPQLSVIGIAGPGDPLANETTFETLELISSMYPELTLCVSTNGLMLPKHAERLYSLGVRFVTVTINAVDPDVSAKIYDSVIWEGSRLSGREGAERLLENQLEGIRRCVDLGMLVKANIVLIPGINDAHIPAVARKMKEMGVYLVNILPLIPVEGTRFSGLRPPTSEERRELMDRCSLDAKMMRHCKQCRADAIGLLGQDRSAEFATGSNCGSGCGPVNPGVLKMEMGDGETRIAVASSNGDTVDYGFGNAPSFRIYASDGGTVRFLRTEKVDTKTPVYGDAHAKHIGAVLSAISDCSIVIVKEIGPRPSKELAASGTRVMLASGDVNAAIRESLS